ncbi:3-oxoacyl-[acyl-carrier-protein] synthase III C-terminal domain-containing protein [Micromonospora sp. NPDC005220]|uniref:3-oxoacyl-ACP synthase III family protein n=1 Tax=Micromonospora sp. NPDC005220 TaxID=3155589 RepID=UPI0033B7E075
MTGISLIDIGRYLPGEPVGTEFYAARIADDARLNWDLPMFRPPRHRHLASVDESAVDMLERAAAPLFDRLGHEARQVDVVLTNVLLPDLPHAGAGASLAHRLGARPQWVFDVHNGGCASFVVMLKMAQMLLTTTSARSAILCNVQNCAGPVFTQPDNVRNPPSAIPGDGACVAYVTASGESPVLDIEVVNRPEAAPDMQIELSDGRKYWQPGVGQLNVRFTEASIARIISRGNQLVPEVVGNLCRRLGTPTSDIDVLVTNQPNRMFLRNWAEALQLPPGRHLDTFDRYGNLFGAGAPITLSHAIEDGALAPGALVVIAGFAHAGDLAAAAAVRWRP